MAGLPISPQSLYSVSRFAQEIWQSCRNAKNQFEHVGREILAMQTAVELVALELEDKTLAVNKLEEDGQTKTYYKQLGIHVGNCQQALQAAHDCLRRYEKVAAWQQLRWGRGGKDDVDGLVADLSSFTTQLDSFAGALNMKNTGMVLGRIGRIEQLLNQPEGSEMAVVDTIMADVANTRISTLNVERYKAVITGYAQELCKAATASQVSGKRNKVDPLPEGMLSDGLAATRARLQNRSYSADTIHSTISTPIERSHSAHPPSKKKLSKANDNKSRTSHSKPPPTLECWLVQIKTGNFTFLAWQKSGKEPQPRGQTQLESMARQFRASQTSTKVADEYDLVGWVVDDRQKSETDPGRYIWRPYAAKLERKGKGSQQQQQQLLDSGVEEQAMVIIARELTPSAQQEADAASRAQLASQETAKKEAKAALATQKQLAKADLARRKSEDAAASRAEKQKLDRAKRSAELRHLHQQVAALRLNQQPTLADKPEAIAAKRAAEKRAKEMAERRAREEMEERRANLGKVKFALLWGGDTAAVVGNGAGGGGGGGGGGSGGEGGGWMMMIKGRGGGTKDTNSGGAPLSAPPPLLSPSGPHAGFTVGGGGGGSFKGKEREKEPPLMTGGCRDEDERCVAGYKFPAAGARLETVVE